MCSVQRVVCRCTHLSQEGIVRDPHPHQLSPRVEAEQAHTSSNQTCCHLASCSSSFPSTPFRDNYLLFLFRFLLLLLVMFFLLHLIPFTHFCCFSLSCSSCSTCSSCSSCFSSTCSSCSSCSCSSSCPSYLLLRTWERRKTRVTGPGSKSSSTWG